MKSDWVHVLAFGLLLCASGCLLIAEPPTLTSDEDGSLYDVGGGNVCDDLEVCCGRLDVEEWERDSCYSNVSYGSESTCTSSLCNWAARDDSCLQEACDVGCELSGC